MCSDEIEKPIEVKKRKEFEIVPDGVSCTETEVAYYLRVRDGKRSITIRVPKDNYFASHVTIDEFASFDPSKWHGVRGTNGPSD